MRLQLLQRASDCARARRRRAARVLVADLDAQRPETRRTTHGRGDHGAERGELDAERAASSAPAERRDSSGRAFARSSRVGRLRLGAGSGMLKSIGVVCPATTWMRLRDRLGPLVPTDDRVVALRNVVDHETMIVVGRREERIGAARARRRSCPNECGRTPGRVPGVVERPRSCDEPLG